MQLDIIPNNLQGELLFLLVLTLTNIGIILNKISKQMESKDSLSESLKNRTRSNLELLKNKDDLFEFILSEAALREKLSSIESQEDEDNEVREYLAKVNQSESTEDKGKFSLFSRAWKSIKENRFKIGEKLFDKLNDIAKGAIPFAKK